MIHKFVGAMALLLMLPPVAAPAQDWPAKQPIKIVVPFTAGSATDIAGRIVFEQVGKQIGQYFVFENRGGAGTTLGAALAANPFVVSTTTQYKSMKDVVAAGSKPGGIFYGTNGPGSSGHLFMEALRLAAGYPITHVPFRGTVEAMTEVIAGRIDMFPAPALNAINLAREGRVNALAVSSPKRLGLMSDVPTLAEIGLPKAQYQFWVGAFAPAKTPKPIVERLNREVVAALHVKETADRIIALGGSPMPMTPAEFDAFVRREIALNGEIV